MAGDLLEPASLRFRLRAIRRKRLASRVSSLTVAVAWVAVVTLLMMVGGGLMNTR